MDEYPPADVLSKAVARAARLLDVRQAKLTDILGLSTVAAARLVAGGYELQSDRAEWELAAWFVRIFRSLDTLVGHGDEAHLWLKSPNRALGETPADLLESAEGLIRVLQYLDAVEHRIAP